MSIDRPLRQKEKAVILDVHPSTISAMTRAGLPRRANLTETIAWARQNPRFTTRSVYPCKEGRNSVR